MTEPILEFIKGKGWVYQERESMIMEYRKQKFRVSIEFRNPKPHESGWCIDSLGNADAILRNLDASGVQQFQPLPLWGWSAAKRRISRDQTYVTVFTEAL